MLNPDARNFSTCTLLETALYTISFGCILVILSNLLVSVYMLVLILNQGRYWCSNNNFSSSPSFSLVVRKFFMYSVRSLSSSGNLTPAMVRYAFQKSSLSSRNPGCALIQSSMALTKLVPLLSVCDVSVACL